MRIVRTLLHIVFPLLALGTVVSGANPDDAFLDDLSHRSFEYFREMSDAKTGFVPDHARADASGASKVTSVAAIGFGLTAWCIGAERGWVPRADAEERVAGTLEFLTDHVPQTHGFLPHFLDRSTGERVWQSEFSSIDTALLMHGVLTARQYFAGTRVTPLATTLYERVDWPWMCNGQSTMCHGWTPESGFLPHHWMQFDEHLGMTLLAIGSPSHPLPATAWHAWQRGNRATYEGRSFLQYPPLFVHQFPQAWWDFRVWRDGDLDYFANARVATTAQRAFCVSLRDRFPGYNENMWGLTSSDSAKGYVDWGGPPIDGRQPDPRIDGTVVPCAVAGSVPFAPRMCIDALKAMRDQFGDRVYGKFGFVDAFNPTNGWTNRDVIGIDVGITLLMIENQRSGFVWKWFGKNPEVESALERAGLQRIAAVDVTEAAVSR